MKTERIYCPINKDKIQEAIDLYNEYWDKETERTDEENDALWSKYCDTHREICPGANVWSMHIFQAMTWSGTLDVEHVYNTILASGTNTVLVEVYDD